MIGFDYDEVDKREGVRERDKADREKPTAVSRFFFSTVEKQWNVRCTGTTPFDAVSE